MESWQLHHPDLAENAPLVRADVPIPTPNAGEIRLRVLACGVCHTDLHIVEGDIPLPRLPTTPGHQIVGMVDALGAGVTRHRLGERVGVPWLYHTCGTCRFCRAGKENLCERIEFTGVHADGGFAEYTIVHEDFAYPLPPNFSDADAAPLLCAGVVGFRSLRQSDIQPGQKLGLYGFGASAHVVIQVARHWGCEVFVFTRSAHHQELAQRMGAVWVGEAADNPGTRMDSSIIFAPAGALVPLALERLERGGTLALGGIYMSDLPAMPYRLLWHERTIRSVANSTRQDVRDFLAVAAEIPIRTKIEPYPLSAVNNVLQRLKASRISGAAVLLPGKQFG